MILALLLSAVIAQPADLVVKNAMVWSDGMTGFASSFAVEDGRFVHVGDYRADLVGPNTTVVDAGGKTVIPGLIDSHVHMISGGGSLTDVNLRDARDKADFIAKLRAYAQAHPERQWITGGRWSTESWADKTEPSRHWLDEAVQDRPVYLTRMDGHSGVANTKALQIAGVTKDTQDPPGGRIVREPDGTPQGILRENAEGLVVRHIPGSSRAELIADLEAAMRHANENGVTAVCDLTSSGSLSMYREIGESSGLTVRFGLYPTLGTNNIASTKASFRNIEDWVELKGVKVFMDGTLGSRTAWMNEPFNNNPADGANNRGLPMPEATNGTIRQIASLCAQHGLQLIGHAIGDRANHELVEFFKATWPDVRKARPRLEHAQHLMASDIPEIGRLGVICSYQPFHKADDGRYAESYIGVLRSGSSYAYKDVLDSGGILAYGSDWPVVTINPFLGIEAAVTGRTLDGKFWQTQNNITVMEALRGYTTSAAYAMFWEDRIGKIAPGYLADFVVLNKPIFTATPDWAGLKPAATYVGGKKVYEGT